MEIDADPGTAGGAVPDEGATETQMSPMGACSGPLNGGCDLCLQKNRHCDGGRLGPCRCVRGSAWTAVVSELYHVKPSSGMVVLVSEFFSRCGNGTSNVTNVKKTYPFLRCSNMFARRPYDRPTSSEVLSTGVRIQPRLVVIRAGFRVK